MHIPQGEYHYFVHWKGYSVKENSWVPLSCFHDTNGIETFHSRAMLEWNFPKRGEISVLMGGPPCQGMSVINRFRNFANPLQDKKNGMVVVFLDYVRYFHPEIVLFENVPGIFSLSDGYVLRFLIASFISMGYQVKQAVLQSAFYGVPQRRWRVIIWAAQKGIRMPLFPSPTHSGTIQVPHVVGRQYSPFAFFLSLCLSLSLNIVSRLSFDRLLMFPQSSDLLPPVTIHDAVSDLPAPSMEKDDNDRQLHYLSPPQNEFQAFVRGRRSTGEQAREGSTSEATVTEHCSRLARESEIAQRKPLRSFNIPAPTVTGKPTVTLLLDARVNRTTPRIPTIREVARFQCLFLTVLLHDNNTANTCACTAFPDDWSFAGNTKSRYQQIGVCSSILLFSLCACVFF